MQQDYQSVALVYVEQPHANAEEEIAELYELIISAHGVVRLLVRQSRNFVDPQTLVGSGKVNEIKNALGISEYPIDVVIFSQHLNALQRKNLQESLEVDVIDNVDLILDIFALRATSAAGKKQVELAQLSYSLATRPDKNYSRQGGGIGTRGPGETQLETDKRIARDKMHRLRKELQEIERQRNVTRAKRLENEVFTVALVGYTNAGKSTLFNKITDNNVYADDRLFATLDTTVRKCEIDGIEVLFCDTVGFIRNLPTALIEAFKSTLEEATFADLVLNVCDVSSPDVASHIAVTEQILSDLDVTAPVVRVYNKCDKIEQFSLPNELATTSPFAQVSAKTCKNLDVLMDSIRQELKRQYATVKLKVPYTDVGIVSSMLQKYVCKQSAEYQDDCVVYTITIRRRNIDKFLNYVTF